MKKNVKKMISKGALGFAVVVGPAAAFVGLSNMAFSELGMNTFMGASWVFALLHLLFRDESFDVLEIINTIIWILSPWLAFLLFFAFKAGAYVAMFICLVFLIVVYVIHLLIDVLNLESAEKSLN